MRYLFPSLTPEYIYYANKPLLLGGTARKMAVQNFEEMIGPSYHYTEAMASADALPFDCSKIKSNQAILPYVLERLKHPLIDSLVICHINDQVGKGVFTQKDIPAGTIVTVYAGEIKQKNSYESEYSLDVDTYKGFGPYSIDAKEMGGIARFIQHIPDDRNLDLEGYVDAVRHPKMIDSFLICRDFENNEERLQAKLKLVYDIQNNFNDFALGYKRHVLEEISHDDTHSWEFKSTRFTSDTIKESVAWANLRLGTAIINNIPVVYFWAPRPISAGEQLGFSYGIGYWAGRNQLPEYFTKKGGLLPNEFYEFDNMPVKEKLPVTKSERLFFYKKTQYNKAAETRLPIQVAPALMPRSFFGMRKELATKRVLNEKYLPLTATSFSQHLKSCLPEEFKVEIYRRDPEDNQDFIVDAVCTAKTMEKWLQLTLLIRNSPISEYCKCFENTKEVMIQGANIDTKKMLLFILYLKKSAAVFERPICKNQAQKDPDVLSYKPI